MQSINFNKGYKEYAINGDEGNPIRLNVSDSQLIYRMQEVPRKLDDIIKDMQLAEDNVPDTLEKTVEFDNRVKELFDYAFGDGFSAKVFGDMSCCALTTDGNYVFEEFMNAFQPVLEADIKEYSKAQESKLKSVAADKYTAHLNNTVAVPTKEELTAEQRELLELFERRRNGDIS